MAFAPPFSRVFPATFDRRAAAAGNGLLNNLVAYWKLDEAAGANDALDAHTNGLTLTQFGSPGSAEGIVGTARTFAGGDYFSRTHETLLALSSADFTFTAWLYLTTKAANQDIIAKFKLTGNKELVIAYNYVADRFRITAYADGSTATSINANNFGSPPLDTWHFVCGQYDSVAQSLSISVNAGTPDSVSLAGVYAGTNPLVVGRLGDYSGEDWKGNADEIGFWKSAAGAGGALSSAQRLALYNAGAGLAYAQFTT